jgi:tetratricopeptide (TPR) repeat protein
VGRSLLPADARPTAGGLAPNGLASASPWLIETLVQKSPIGIQNGQNGQNGQECSLRESVLRASLALRPEESWYARELSEKAAAAGRSDEAADLAQRYAAAHLWASSYVLEALAPLALMPGAGSDPRVRAALESMLGRVSLLVQGRAKSGDYFPRSAFPEYWAARAALARDPDEAAEHWRQAVALLPRSAAYRNRLADALQKAGRTAEAREARQWAAAVETSPVCPGDRS